MHLTLQIGGRISARLAAATCAATLSVGSAHAQFVQDTFEPGTNSDGWVAWNSAYTSTPAFGGLPLEHLRLDNINVGPPGCHNVIIEPSGPRPFAHSGNWRTAGVRQVTVDIDVRQGRYGGIFCLFIARDPGTPSNPNDDCLLVLIHPDGAPLAPGWRRYTFDVPAQQSTAPPGWFGESVCVNASASAVWNNVLPAVDRMFFVLDANPGSGCIPTRWEVVVDNITVSRGELGTAYCNGQPNSTGGPARLWATGSNVVAANDLDFTVGGLPQNSFGYFITSEAPNRSPVFSGNLCVTGVIKRFSLSVLHSGATGQVLFSPDLANPPQGAQFVVGRTWNFQYWFRDIGPTANFSDAVAVWFE